MSFAVCWTSFALRSPRAASASMRDLRALTSDSSAATKKAFARTITNTAMSRSTIALAVSATSEFST
jgi:hypothetical protein